MTRAEAEKEMIEGYLTGFRSEPAPGDNRSYSFRHGWANGRDDKERSPRATASELRAKAEFAILMDTEDAWL